MWFTMFYHERESLQQTNEYIQWKNEIVFYWKNELPIVWSEKIYLSAFLALQPGILSNTKK